MSTPCDSQRGVGVLDTEQPNWIAEDVVHESAQGDDVGDVVELDNLVLHRDKKDGHLRGI
jgi:hypothetical protein